MSRGSRLRRSQLHEFTEDYEVVFTKERFLETEKGLHVILLGSGRGQGTCCLHET